MREVSSIQYEQKVMEKESQKKMSKIEDETYLARMKARADADFYTAEREASANKVSTAMLKCGLVPDCYTVWTST